MLVYTKIRTKRYFWSINDVIWIIFLNFD